MNATVDEQAEVVRRSADRLIDAAQHLHDEAVRLETYIKDRETEIAELRERLHNLQRTIIWHYEQHKDEPLYHDAVLWRKVGFVEEAIEDKGYNPNG